MTTEKILQVVALYRERFKREDIIPKRMNEKAFFSSEREMLEHAHFLLDGIVDYATQPGKQGKTGRHLGSVQMLLWVARWYTLEELKNHNRPD